MRAREQSCALAGDIFLVGYRAQTDPPAPPLCLSISVTGCDKIPTFVDPAQALAHPQRFCAAHKQPHFITLHRLAAIRKGQAASL